MVMGLSVSSFLPIGSELKLGSLVQFSYNILWHSLCPGTSSGEGKGGINGFNREMQVRERALESQDRQE